MGPIEVFEDGRLLPLGGPKQRLVLAHLILRASRVVSVHDLIEAIWGEEPPDTARGTLQTYVSHLRRALGERLEGRPPGYLLQVNEGELDAASFEAMVKDAKRSVMSDPTKAVAGLTEALTLWRGAAFADLADESSLQGEIARLDELRLAATEHQIAAELQLGRHSAIVSELEALTARYPMRERLWAHLMLAMYRTGRQGDALTAYQRAREVLADELGVDPSPELRGLYERILRQDPGLEPPAPTAVASPRPASELLPETVFAGYRIEQVLGRGGMSVVYLAEHLGLKRKVALKVMASQLAEDQRFRDRFVRESQIAASLDHPNVIPIYEAGDADGRLFLAMRYVEGTDLRALLRSGGALDPPRAVQIVRQVADALDAAHERGLVHRDVKPANVLLARRTGTDDGEHAYLSDFGLTRRAASESGVTGTGQFVGTLDYAAPEQFKGAFLDARTDVYSLGCVLFECLTGRPPFRRENDAAVMYAHLFEDRPSACAERPELDEEVDDVLATAMAKDPADRYPSAGELASAAAIAIEEPTRERVEPRRRRRPTGRRRRTVFTIAAVVATVALLAVFLPIVGGDEANETFRPGTVLLDLETGAQIGFISPSRLAVTGYPTFSDGRFWVNNFFPASYVGIDARSGAILNEVSSPPADPDVIEESITETPFAVDGNELWVGAADDLVKIDLERGDEVARFHLDEIVGQPGVAEGVAVGSGSVWAGFGEGHLGPGQIVRLDAATGAVEHVFTDMAPHVNLAFEDGSLWVADETGVVRIDPQTNVVTRVANLGDTRDIAAGGGFGWTSDATKGVVYKVDPAGRIVATYDTGLGANRVSYSNGFLWVANSDEGTVTGIDAVTGKLTTYRFDHPVDALAAGDGVLLVRVRPGRSVEDSIDALTGDVARFFAQKGEIWKGEPALDDGPAAFQIEFATCAKLLNYPDEPAPAGWLLQPEIAVAMPTLSDDRRTYTFTVRSAYRFSPPSNEPVTAETIRYSIERALSPKLGPDTPGPRFIGDIVGERAFLEGEADQISGLLADGDTLTIELVRPSPDFLHRLALPYFCPVPSDTPFVPGSLASGSGVGGGFQIPSAGPYYVADHNNEEYVILKPNPNYTGPRPQALDAIVIREGVDPSIAVDRIENEGWDGITNMLGDSLLSPQGSLSERYAGDGAGAHRYVAVPMANTEYVAFNASRPLFSDPRVRRAAAHALNRSALAAVWGEVPADDVLPPNMPGYTDREVYATRPDIEEANATMRGPGGTAIMALLADCPECRQFGEGVKAALAPIGIDVRLVEVEDVFGALRRPDTRFDLFDGWTFLDYPDPASFLTKMLGEDVPASWLPAAVRGEVGRLSGLTGAERTAAAANLAARLQSIEVPIAPIGWWPTGELLSSRLGCQVFPPFGFGVDLAALCLNEG